MKKIFDSPAVETGRGADAYALDRKAIDAIIYAVGIKDQSRFLVLIAPLHPADIADLLEQINVFERHRLKDLYSGKFDGDILAEFGESIREEVIATLQPDILAEAVRDLESDEVVDLLEHFQKPQINIILKALAKLNRLAVEKSLTYPEFSAGRLMQSELIVFRSNAKRLPEQFDHVTLVVPKLQPLANVTLGKLMLSPRDVLLTAIVEEEFCVIPVLQDEADVAYALNQYLLIFAPVVDESHRLTGMITIEDAMEMLEDENQEDILRLAGVTDNNLSDWVLETIKQRPPWLAVNLVSAILASLVIAQFEATITQLVALVVLMPIVASMGGNAATQTFKAAVQALSTHDLTPSNLWRVVRREAFVGLLNGVVFAVVMGCVGIICSGSSALDYVVLRATLHDFIVAGLAGTLVTVVLDRSGVDSALGLVLLSPRSRSRMWLGFSPFWVWLHGCCHE